jgi:hypothetical protein
MKLYEPWRNCLRCARSEMRWGIFAPSGRAPKVLVLSAVATRPAQAIGAPDPLPARVAEQVCLRWKLATREVHIDVLVACGPSTDAHPHEAAACTQRLHDQGSGWPTLLVVLVGDYTARLARLAGLLDDAGFRAGLARIPLVVIRDPDDVGVDPAWQTILGRPTEPVAPAATHAGADALLWRLVDGTCVGSAWRPRSGEWTRKPGRKPRLGDVRSHVRGKGWLAPLRPTGFWPYCVIDVDVHNAIQLAEVERVRKELLQHCANSFFFQSSRSGGFHVYVKLPPDTRYAEGALWLAEFLATKRLLFTRVRAPHGASMGGAVATRLAEVPLHPPRLPFGLESVVLHPRSMRPVEDFDDWLRAAPPVDYEAACAGVRRAGGPTVSDGRWPERAAWTRTYMADLELASVLVGAPGRLATSDPWSKYVSRCAPSLRRVIVDGCPAYGTRTGIMYRLAKALTELADLDEARDLVRHWVEHRRHYSEEIETAPADVLAFADRILTDEYKKRGGVPEAVWAHAEQLIQSYYLPQSGPWYRATATLPPDELRRAAFHVVRLFYRKRQQVIVIVGEQFGIAIANNKVGALPTRRPNKAKVKTLSRSLCDAGVLKPAGAASFTSNRGASFELKPPLWPPPLLGGRILYRCP